MLRVQEGGHLLLEAFVDAVGGVGGQVLADIGVALERVAGVAGFFLLGVDGDQVIAEFVLDELAVVENMFEVFLRIVVKLRDRGGTMVRKSLKTMPSPLCLLSERPWEKNLKRRLILSFSGDLNILAT